MTSRKWKKKFLKTHLAYFPASRGLSRRGKNCERPLLAGNSFTICLHPEIYSKSKCVSRVVIVQERIPRIISKTNRLRMLLILHPTNTEIRQIWLFSAIVENSVLVRMRLASNQRRYQEEFSLFIIYFITHCYRVASKNQMFAAF